MFLVIILYYYYMCFSFEVSLATFITSWSISIYLLTKKLNKTQKQNIIILMIFSSMQLVDAVLWYIKMEKNKINYYLSSIAIPSILSILLLYCVFIKNNSKNIYINIISILLCVYIFIRSNGYSSSVCNNKLSSPVWGSNEFSVWELVIYGILVTYPNWTNFFCLLLLLLFIKITVGGAYGSLWCAPANLFAFKYLFTY